jgi:phosphoserine phosphatase
MAHEELLASWVEGPTRSAVVDFVDSVTSDGPHAVPPAERIMVTDNDGTLWSEKPIPVQLVFTLGRLAEMANADPSLRHVEPYRASAEGDMKWLNGAMVKHYQGDDSDLGLLMKAVETAFASVSVEQFMAQATTWLETATHPGLKRPYKQCGYLPMTELIRYLEANDFTVYIASGGDRDFMRAVAEEIYGIPPERVIGSSLGLEVSEDDDGVTGLLYKSAMDFFDDGPEKPVRIWSRIGRRPLISIGNSNGDVPMLRFARSNGRTGLRLLIAHDDAEREFDYSAGAEHARVRATEKGWTVISMKDDWSQIFA